MTPKTSKPGTSIKGAALYLLHDKRSERQAAFNENAAPQRDIWEMQTGRRVEFIETHNLPTNDPRLATACMIDTATHAADLKRANGMKGTAVKKASFHYSLSWPYDQGQAAPDKAEMMQAAHETLKLQGLQDHQAIIVAHNDAKHPHIHILVNLVHPETGKAQDIRGNHYKLSKWAQRHEEERGQVLSPQRVENNARRDKGEYVKHGRVPRQEYEQRKAQERQQQPPPTFTPKYEPKAAPALTQSLNQNWQDFRADRDLAYRQAKAHNKPEWRALFKEQRQALKEFDKHYISRLKVAMKENKGRGILGAAVRSLFDKYSLRRDLVKQHEQERKDLSQRQRERTKEQVNDLYQRYKGRAAHIQQEHNRRRDQERARSKSPTARQQAVEQERTAKQQRQRDGPEAQASKQAAREAAKEAHREKIRQQVAEQQARARTGGRTRSRTRRRDGP